ncbi:hypothetical protein N7513_008195 [Penicillium frequentans]|nr:hypothetical protein N7513_008195 [Penicillium glabrum]
MSSESADDCSVLRRTTKEEGWTKANQSRERREENRKMAKMEKMKEGLKMSRSMTWEKIRSKAERGDG